jgi:branched-chain amino acid transport system substrate-binding protein
MLTEGAGGGASIPWVVSRKLNTRGEAMGAHRFWQWWKVPFLVACLSLIVGCTTLGGMRREAIFPQPAPTLEAARSLYSEAERAYQARDYAQARLLYQRLIDNYPQSPLVADAFFRLGEILYYEGDYPDAQQTLQDFLTKFPGAKLAPEASYLRAMSLLHLQRYAEASAVLDEAQRASAAASQQPFFLLARAHIASAQGQHLQALEELQGLTTARPVPAELKAEARNLAIELVNVKLTAAELEQVKRRWPGQFPTDYVLLRQAKEASKRRDMVQAEAVAKEFLSWFPDHADATQMHALLADLERLRTVNVDRHKIGVVVPLSSPKRREWVSEVGQNALQGMQVAFAREGFSPLKMEVRDSRANLSTTAAVVEELITVQRVIALVGPLFNETTEVAVKKALQWHVPLITPGAPAFEIPADNPYVVRTSLTNRLEARRLAEYAVGNLGLRRIAVLYPDDLPGRQLAETFHTRLIELGGEIIVRQSYAPNQVDFTAALRQLGGQTDEELQQASRESGGGIAPETVASVRGTGGKLTYEALYLPRSFERLQFLIPALRLYNIAGVTLLGESGWNHPDLLKRAGTFVEGAVFMDGFFAGSSDPEVREFVQSYRAMFNAEPDLTAAQSHDAMLMLLRVLKQKPQSREEVRDQLKSLRDVRAATGWMSMLPEGDVDKRLFALTVRRGRIVQLN